MKTKTLLAIWLNLACALTLAACAGTPPPAAEHVIYQNVEKEVPRPCPVKIPPRPAKLQRPLPTDPAALADVLIAKLLEWDGPGKYGDQADAALKLCTAPSQKAN